MRRGFGSVCIAALCGVLAAALLCASYTPTERGIYYDNQIYFYMSERVASGEPPHVSLVDHKHQLSTMLSGWAISIGRSLDLDDVMAGRGLSIGFALAFPALIALLAAQTWGSAAAAWLAAALCVSFVDFYFMAVVGFRPKVFMAVFLAMALLAHARRRPLLAGLLASASFHCWQPALLLSAAIGASLLLHARWREAFRFCVGFGLLTIGYEAWFLWQGALGEQLFQSYEMPANREGYQYPSLMHGLEFFASMGLWRQNGQAIYGLGFLMLVAAIPAVGLARFRYWYERCRAQPAIAAWAFLSLAAVAMTFLDHQGYPDLFFIQPLLAVGLAGVTAALMESLPLRRPLRLLVTGLLVVAIVWNGSARANLFQRARGGLAKQRELARVVGLMEEEYGAVWAIGCPHFLALERRKNFSPFGLLIDPKVRAYAAEKYPDSGLDPIRNGLRPGVLITSRGGETLSMRNLQAYYTRVQLKAWKDEGVNVWVARSGRRRAGGFLPGPPQQGRKPDRAAKAASLDDPETPKGH